MLSIELDDDELRDCTMACRLAAKQAHEDADNRHNRLTSVKHAADAERYTLLAERFDAARRLVP